MNLVEVRNQLFSHFIENDTFLYPKDVSSIKVDDEQSKFAGKIVKRVLDTMVTDNVVDVVEIDNSTLAYITTLPLAADHQEVTISANTANLIAEVINQYQESAEATDYYADKFNITDSDMQAILGILTQLLNNQK